MKLNLILSRTDWTTFHNCLIQSIAMEYFNFIYIEDNVLFSKNNSLIIAMPDAIRISSWYNDLYQQGYKVVYDILLHTRPIINEIDALVLTLPNFNWYYDSIIYSDNNHQAIGFKTYIPQRTYKKIALMPMGRSHDHREMFFNAVTEYLDNFIWSFKDRGIRLPNDTSLMIDDNFYFNPEWYNDTYFSIVIETGVYKTQHFMSEKTFKPIAFQHPFMILGQSYLLEHLHNIGFETYENIFDESYDLELDLNLRIIKMVENIKSFDQVPYDKITEGKNST